MAMAAVTDVGMLFLRCLDGISHHPDEDVREVDVAVALDAFDGGRARAGPLSRRQAR